MKKNSTKGYAILGILFALISVIAFAIPTTKTITFWIAYAFTAVAFAAQIAIWKIALGKEETLKSKFLGFPIIHIGIVYLILQIITSIIAQFVRFTNDEDTMPAWLKDFCQKIMYPGYFLKTIEELSKLVPYSRSILNSAFKEYMNETLISFITKQRINYAANLLSFSDYTIVDISYMINYSSLSHFNRTFKSILGYTPSEYRHMFLK